MRRRVLAAPALDDAAGGTGAVARLVWRVMQATWPEHAELLELDHVPSTGQKALFGARLGAVQTVSRAQWVLFGHLALARAQQILPRRLRAPYAIFLHGVEAWAPLAGGDRRRLRSAQLRVANSQFTADRTAAVNPGLGPIDVCHLALPRELEDRPLPARRRRPRVLTVGRMAVGEGYKGHDQLIEAWPHVVAAIPDAELVIAGDGLDAARLRDRARRVSGAITFAGFVDRGTLDQLYEQAAVFAMPSRGEGFGLVYLEAMAHHLPCIGSVHDAAGEVVEHGKTGLLVDLDDPGALGRALLCLLRDEEMRSRMGKAGADRLKRQFSFDRFSSRLVSLLESRMEGPAE